MSLALLFLYLMLNMFRMLIHPSSGACDLFVDLFHGLYCSGSMCVGVTLCFGCGGVVSVCRLRHNVTPTHIEPEQYNLWNNSTNKSQAPEDGCINIRNMLNIKYRNNKASDIKQVSLYSAIYFLSLSPLPLRVQISLPYKRMGTARALYTSIRKNIWIEVGFKMLFKIPSTWANFASFCSISLSF